MYQVHSYVPITTKEILQLNTAFEHTKNEDNDQEEPKRGSAYTHGRISQQLRENSEQMWICEPEVSPGLLVECLVLGWMLLHGTVIN